MIKFKDSSLIKTAATVHVKVSGAVHEPRAMHVRASGITQGIWSPPFIIYISGTAMNFNLYNAFQTQFPGVTPRSYDTVVCVVQPDGLVGAGTTAGPAWTTGTGWPANIDLQLINLGHIVGAGGKGGDAFVAMADVGADSGAAGGTAVSTSVGLLIDNRAGEISGGGGGGGGAARATDGSWGYSGDAAGGGGGAGLNAGNGGTATGNTSSNGSPGTLTNRGTRGYVHGQCYGGHGGNLGAPGLSGFANPPADQFWLPTSVGAGGAAGKAIVGISHVEFVEGLQGTLRGGVA